MPKRKAKPTYNEEAWALAKLRLPKWAYILVHNEARGRSGGLAAAANRRARKEAEAAEAIDKASGAGLIAAIWLPQDIAQQLAVPGGEAAGDLHCTLAFFGDVADLPEGSDEILTEAIERAVIGMSPLTGKIGGPGRFNPSEATGGKAVIYASLDVPGLTEFRERIVMEAAGLGLEASTEHDFTPHVTLGYAEPDAGGLLPVVPSLAVAVNTITIAAGGKQREIEIVTKAIAPTTGPRGAAIAFVGASPTRIEVARGEPLVGPHGQTFVTEYLPPLGLERDEVVVTNAVPMLLTAEGGGIRQPTDDEIDQWAPWLAKQLEHTAPRIVVAMGQAAKRALGDRADFVLPHPGRVRTGSAHGQLERKLKQIRKAIDAPPEWGPEVVVTKADEAKQIVYGIVLSAYGKEGSSTDAHNDWIPPGTIEQTAHEWFGASRKIGISHPGQPGHTTVVDAESVESSIENYLPGEYAKAMRGEPHKVTRRQFGSDVVYSGDWILGTKLGAKSWAAFKKGVWNAYSVEGAGLKMPAPSGVMPAVEFVDLKPA